MQADNPQTELNAASLQSLVDQGSLEGHFLEFKEALPDPRDPAEAKKVAKAISAFANSDGGRLIYGVRAEQGVATELAGLSREHVDAGEQRVRGINAGWICPPVAGIETSAVELPNGSFCLVVKVPRSWSGPHLAKSGASNEDTYRMYIREGNGSRPVDHVAIRAAFGGADSLPQRIRAWRAARFELLARGHGPVLRKPGAFVVVHMIPFASVSGFGPSLAAADIRRHAAVFSVPRNPWAGGRVNLDGFVQYSKHVTNENRAYCQIFRNGCVEAVVTDIVELGERTWCWGDDLERAIFGTAESCISGLKKLGVDRPLVLNVTLCNMTGSRLCSRHRHFFHDEELHFDRHEIILPELILEAGGDDLATEIRPLFDALWNAGGYSASLNFGSDGKWVGG